MSSALLPPKIQQTKMLVTCQSFGYLFLFGLVWQYSSVQTKYSLLYFGKELLQEINDVYISEIVLFTMALGIR